MPVLRIDIKDDVWPTVLAALESATGPIPPGADPKVWAQQVAAQWFAVEIAGLVDPPEPARPRSPIRPSRVRP